MPEQLISASGPQYGLLVNSDGSINTAITGSIFIGSVSAQVDSIYVQSGNNLHLGSAWNQIGSVYVSNIVPISGTVTSSTGSNVWIQNPVGISGINDIGSVVIKSAPLIGVSGAIFDSGDITGSMVISSASRLGVSGNVVVTATDLDIRDLSSASDSVGVVGSVRISAPPLGISGTIFTDGNLTGSMVISSSVRLGGSIVNLPGDLGSVTVSSSSKIGVSGIVEVSGITHDFTTTYKQYMDYEGGMQPVYIGLALPGTGSEIAEWFIRKYIYENDLSVATLFGSGNTNFDKKWSERSGIYAEYS